MTTARGGAPAATGDGRRQGAAFAVLLLAAVTAPVLLVLLWPAPGAVYPAWDFANAAGYLALALWVLLFLYRGRPRAFPPWSGRFFANLHRDLGYLALFLLLLHVGLLLVAEPLLLEHLRPTAPLHMLSGLLALLLMLCLVLSSLPGLRRRLWPDYHRFRHLHALVAVACLALAVFHVVESGFYLNAPWKLALAGSALVAVLAAYVLGHNRPARAVASRMRDSARRSHLLAWGVGLGALLLCLALVLLRREAG